MNQGIAQIRLLLLILGILVMTGCRRGGTHPLSLNEERLTTTRRQIVKTLPDADRRQHMLDIIDDFETNAGQTLSDIKAVRVQIVEANRDYDTTRAEMERLYAQQEQGFEKLLSLTKAYSLRLRTLCSREEWTVIFAHEDRAIRFRF